MEKEIRKVVNGKLKDRVIKDSHVELYEKMFGKRLSSSEARKRMYGINDYLDKTESVSSKGSKIKCLIVNDIHLPFERDDVLEIVRENRNVDYIIIGGDMIDCVSCTSFDTMNRPSVEEELVYAYEFIGKINNIIDPTKTKIIAIEGNHEARYKKNIIRMIEKQMQSLLNPALLSMLSDGFDVYPKGKKVTYKPIENFEYVDNWYVRLFDNLIVAHPLNFSNVGAKVSEQISEYMLNYDVFDKGDMIIFGHTHKFSMVKNNRRQGVFVVENGCLCRNMDYASVGKLSFTQQNYGYTILEFNDGEKIDINDVKFIHLN